MELKPQIGDGFLLEMPGGPEPAWAALTACHIARTQQELVIGGCFEGPWDAVLRPENLLPRFDGTRFSHSTRVSQEVLDHCARAGVLRPVLLDYVDVCPRCQSLPTFRSGCQRCLSGRVAVDQYIHHFACAHVDRSEQFDRDGQISCPKCRTRRLVIGADYEYLQVYRCEECKWSDWQSEKVGHCLSCGHRFPAREAGRQALCGYQVRRLDPTSLTAEVQEALCSPT